MLTRFGYIGTGPGLVGVNLVAFIGNVSTVSGCHIIDGVWRLACVCLYTGSMFTYTHTHTRGGGRKIDGCAWHSAVGIVMLE